LPESCHPLTAGIDPILDNTRHGLPSAGRTILFPWGNSSDPDGRSSWLIICY